MAEKTKFVGTGKRKCSVARVSLFHPGKGILKLMVLILIITFPVKV